MRAMRIFCDPHRRTRVCIWKMASGGNHGQDQANVNFVCQRCCQPLKLDPSFSYLDEHIMNDLTVPLIINSDTSDAITLMPDDSKHTTCSSEVEISRKHIPPVRLTESGNGFMIVGDANNGDTECLSYHLKVTARLFDIMSDQSDIDHPLCEECTDVLLDQMDEQLKSTEDECRDYRDLLDKLEREPCEDDLDALEEELKIMTMEKERLEEELKLSEAQRQQSEVELQRQREEKEKLDAEEERYWKEYCNQKRLLLQHESEQRSVENQLKCAQAQWDKLRKTNVFNATFHIWHSGQFGTINNFRLGRLPNVPVEWNEINAAWGQTVLLLHSMARKINLTFQRYRLVPYGNHSYLESLTDKYKELPLYGSGGFRFFWDTKFDQAMVAFLDCLQQFKEEVEKGDTGFRLPYKMDKGRIEDTSSGNSYSVKIQFNSEEQWTKALKFMLTNLRWGLAWVASQFNNK